MSSAKRQSARVVSGFRPCAACEEAMDLNAVYHFGSDVRCICTNCFQIGFRFDAAGEAVVQGGVGMSVELSKMTDQERQRLTRVDELRAKKARGELVSDALLAEAEKLAFWAVQNAEAREKNKAERQAKADAQMAAQKKRVDERVTKAQEAYMQRRRFEFRGTDAQWEQLKPRILEEYLLGGGDETERRRVDIGF